MVRGPEEEALGTDNSVAFRVARSACSPPTLAFSPLGYGLEVWGSVNHIERQILKIHIIIDM